MAVNKFKHLNLENASINNESLDLADGSQTRSWFCSPKMESLRFVHSKNSTLTIGSELTMMAADIRAAITAAAEGHNHSDQDKEHTDEDVDQHCGLIPGKKLYSIEMGAASEGAPYKALDI